MSNRLFSRTIYGGGDYRWLGLLLLAAWTLLNLLQAGHTQLDPDEAYYWMYAQYLDWGYFDHPPAIALLIRWGSNLFGQELGVRFFIVLLQSAGLVIWWDLAGRPRSRDALLTFGALLVAMPWLQVYGFIATPDSPLLFFALVFFWAYRRFADRPAWWTALLLGATMAALLYSKYHGVLLIGFTVLSGRRWWRQPWIYLAGLFGLLLFLPHLYWQYAQDFPSFRYHLLGRDDPYELKHTYTYLFNQLVIFNPLLFPLFLYALARTDWRATPLFRAFGFIIFGFWIFFLLTTFKGHVEPQWTAVLTIPLVLVAFEHARRHLRFRRWVQKIGLFSLVLFLGARLTLILPELAFDFNKAFHRKAWTYDLQTLAAGAPVVFQNSYRDASKYAFYTGEPAYTFTDKDYRRNQFDIWGFESELHNRRVLLAGHRGWKCTDCEVVELTRKAYRFKWVDSLQITQQAQLRFSGEQESWTAGNVEETTVTFVNPYDHSIDREAGNMPVRVVALLYDGGEKEAACLSAQAPPSTRIIPAQTEKTFPVNLTVPDSLEGTYQLIWGIQTGDLPPAFSSRPVPLKVRRP